MQSIRLAEFSISPKGELTLLRGARRELLIDPSLDASRPEQIQVALKDILRSWKLRTGTVSCVLPAHSVFVRVVPIDVPGGLSGQVDAVARFEAQQNIPFSLNEVVWDFSVMGELPNGAVNVVFLAVKTSLIESICEAVTGSGLRISSITVSLLALHDALRYSNRNDDYTGTTLLIDIGSRTTNLVVVSPGPLFCRSIPTGGLAVTSAIAKDIHTTPEEAEHLKITRGSVGLGPNFAPPSDPVEANLAKITRQSLIKTQAEIARSLSFYRSNLGGAEPDRILLTGGMAAMPYLAEFIQEKFQKPVGFWNIRHVSGGSESLQNTPDFAEENPNNMGELIGGALQFLPRSQHTAINLLPPTLARNMAFGKRLPTLAAAAILIILSLSAWAIFGFGAARSIRGVNEKFSQESARLEQLNQRIEGLAKNQAEIRKTTSSILSVVLLREAYPKIISELASKVPERYLWITEVQPAVDAPQKDPSGKPSDSDIRAVIVKGLYLDNPRQAAVVDDFVANLQTSALFAIVEKEKSKVIIQRSGPNGEFWAYPFALRIPLRNPIPPTLP